MKYIDNNLFYKIKGATQVVENWDTSTVDILGIAMTFRVSQELVQDVMNGKVLPDEPVGGFVQEDVLRLGYNKKTTHKIMKHLRDHFDANNGINWQTIEDAADAVR